MSLKKTILPITDQSARIPSRNDTCQVCGDKACIINYGALSCPSCKTFFRRHGYHSKNLECHFEAECFITTETRKYCSACRFAKCLAAGMNSDFIRKEDLSSKNRQGHSMKYKQMTLKKTMPVVHLPTLNLLRQDQSSLTPFDWTMLSNVIHAFDKFTPASQTRQLTQHLTTWPQHLSFDISQVLSLFSQFYSSTDSFISSSADFQTLTLAEKQSLYQRNLHGVLNLYATFILSMTGMFNISSNESILTNTYEYNIYHRMKNIIMKLEDDVIVIKFMLIILAFSSNCFMVDEHEHIQPDRLLLGTFRLLGSQNMYIEILWKYMIYRYDYYTAGMRLLLIVKTILDLLQISADIHRTNDLYHDFIEESAELAENSLTKHNDEVIVLWGRT
ncbi:hypothetical protein I4U23_019563 [Adineta vaga]|nr:hypothetical protein I4U23_019563 [Adineta vaga]